MADAAAVYTWEWTESPEQSWQRTSPEVGAVLSNMGYRPLTQTVRGGSFEQRYSPGIFILLYVILFPIGLLLLLARPTRTISITIDEAAGGGARYEARCADKRADEFFKAIADKAYVATARRNR